MGRSFERISGQTTTADQNTIDPSVGADAYAPNTTSVPWRPNYNQVAPIYTNNVGDGSTQGGYNGNQNPNAYDQTAVPPPVQDVNNPNGVPIDQTQYNGQPGVTMDQSTQLPYNPNANGAPYNPNANGDQQVQQQQQQQQQGQQQQGDMSNGGVPQIDPRQSYTYDTHDHSSGASLPLTLVVGGAGGALGAGALPRLLHRGADSILASSAEGGSALSRFNFLDSVGKVVPESYQPKFDAFKARFATTGEGAAAEGGSMFENAAKLVKDKVGLPGVQAATQEGAATVEGAEAARNASSLSKLTEGPLLKNAGKGALFAGAVWAGNSLVDSVLGGDTMFKPKWTDAALMGTTFMMPINDPKLKFGLLAGEYALGRLSNMDTGSSLLATGIGAAATVGLTRGNPRLMAGMLAAEAGGWVLSRFMH